MIVKDLDPIMRRSVLLGVLFIAAVALTVSYPTARAQEVQIESLVPNILKTIPHQANSYIEGLFWVDGTLYESAGQYGESGLLQLNAETGAVIRRRDLWRSYFGEGIALVGKRLIQMTWLERIAFVYNVDTFEMVGAYRYEGEGWGLCYDGTDLYMSNGSADIFIRDPNTFEVKKSFTVTVNGTPLTMLNELECVGDQVYANVYQTTRIVRFNKADGKVNAVINGDNLLQEAIKTAQGRPVEVMNGIAYQPEKKFFYLTGKYWPLIFEVDFVPEPKS